MSQDFLLIFCVNFLKHGLNQGIIPRRFLEKGDNLCWKSGCNKEETPSRQSKESAKTLGN